MERHGSSEYLVLRQTITQRGALRPVCALAGFTGWAAVLVAVLVWLPYPVAAVIPFALLFAAFEVIRPLHFGSERIGRYLQVFYEEVGVPDRPLTDAPGWERVAMRVCQVIGTVVILLLILGILNGR